MQESKEEKSIRRKLFGTLFGFKAGDRVKIWKRYDYYWDAGDEGYWRYGTIQRVVLKQGYLDDLPRYDVLLDGDHYSLYYKAEDLVKVRKYVRKKKT